MSSDSAEIKMEKIHTMFSRDFDLVLGSTAFSSARVEAGVVSFMLKSLPMAVTPNVMMFDGNTLVLKQVNAEAFIYWLLLSD